MTLKVGKKVRLGQPLHRTTDKQGYEGVADYRVYKKSHTQKWEANPQLAGPAVIPHGTEGVVIYSELSLWKLSYVTGIMFTVNSSTRICVVIIDSGRSSATTTDLGTDVSSIYGKTKQTLSNWLDKADFVLDTAIYPATPVADDIARDLDNL